MFYISEMNTNWVLFFHSVQTGGAHPCLNGTQIAPFTALFLTGVQQGGTVIAARIPPEYAPNFSGKNSGGNGSFKRRNGWLSQLPELCFGPPDPWGFARLLGFPGFRSPPGIPREQPLPYGAYNRFFFSLTTVY